jgi:hypothetical protein
MNTSQTSTPCPAISSMPVSTRAERR